MTSKRGAMAAVRVLPPGVPLADALRRGILPVNQGSGSRLTGLTLQPLSDLPNRSRLTARAEVVLRIHGLRLEFQPLGLPTEAPARSIGRHQFNPTQHA